MEALVLVNSPGSCRSRGLRPRTAPGAKASPKLAGMASDDPGDEALMLRYARGDAQAFDTLYGRHRAPLWRFLSRQLQDETSTADVFQETWSRVISHRLRYEPRAKFGT